MLARIAWRSIWRNKRRTLITVVSIGLGLAIAIFFISLGEGMYDQMIDQVVRMQAGYITFEHPEYLEAPSVDLWVKLPDKLRTRIDGWRRVDGTKLLVIGQGIAKSGSGNVAAGIMGVEPSIEALTSPIAKNLVAGSYLQDGDEGLVIIGAEMAERLNLSVGKKMVLSSNDVNGDLVEELCRVKGIFRTGSEEMDAFFVQAPIDFTRKFYGIPEGGATQVGVLLKDADEEGAVLKKLKKLMAGRPVVVLPWQTVMPDLASYIRLDKGSNFVFQGILIFLILFTIFNTLLMSVLEREREFAVLLALGTRPGQLRRQILFESLFIALVGSAVGLILGGLFSFLGHVYGIDLSAIMGESVSISGFALTSKMHTKISAGILFGSATLVFAATMLLSLFPMRRASNVNIVEMIR